MTNSLKLNNDQMGIRTQGTSISGENDVAKSVPHSSSNMEIDKSLQKGRASISSNFKKDQRTNVDSISGPRSARD